MEKSSGLTLPSLIIFSHLSLSVRLPVYQFIPTTIRYLLISNYVSSTVLRTWDTAVNMTKSLTSYVAYVLVIISSILLNTYYMPETVPST